MVIFILNGMKNVRVAVRVMCPWKLCARYATLQIHANSLITCYGNTEKNVKLNNEKIFVPSASLISLVAFEGKKKKSINQFTRLTVFTDVFSSL